MQSPGNISKHYLVFDKRSKYMLFIRFLYEVRIAQSLVFCVVFCRLLSAFCLLVIVLSVHRFMASDYHVGIFKLFLFSSNDTIEYLHHFALLALGLHNSTAQEQRFHFPSTSQ